MGLSRMQYIRLRRAGRRGTLSGMAVSELDMVARTKGRAAKPVIAEFVREILPADVALLASERGIQPKPIQKLRDRHHALARCLASGMADAEAAAITGYDVSRISILRNDATFRELLSHYRTMENEVLAEFMDRATTLSLTAMNNLQERLENDEEPLSASMELEIAKFAADRTGHAPIQRNVNVNASLDLGNRLDQARRRLKEVGADNPTRLINVSPKPSGGG